MLKRLTLRNASLLAQVVPQAGGGLARLDWVSGAEPVPLLRPLPPEVDELPLPSTLACFPLVPWSNRMAPSGFLFQGRRHAPAPNRAGEPCPIHGDGWQQEWQVEHHDDAAIVLALDRRHAGPFSYTATLRYALDGPSLAVELAVTNAGGVALPFGLGLHPWLPDATGARLRARAGGVWLAGPDKLPVTHQLAPSWDFCESAPLPEGLDNVFTLWDGEADIRWPARGVGLALQADMQYFILYVQPGVDVFCFEPVDHPINAHNLPGQPGLTVLAPGSTLRRRCVFRGRAL